eukprot:gene654-479_t
MTSFSSRLFLFGALIVAFANGLGGEKWTGLYSRIKNEIDAHDGNILFHKGTYYWYAMQYTDCVPGFSHSSVRKSQFQWLEWSVSFTKPKVCGFNCASIMFPTNVQSKEERCGFLYASEEQLPFVWQSTDLVNWKRVDHIEPKSGGVFGSAIKSLTGIVNGRQVDISKHIIFRPFVLYNEKNDEFVLWVNAIPGGHTDKYVSIFEAYVYGAFAVFTSKNAEGPFELVNFDDNTNPGLLPYQDLRTRGAADFGLLLHEGKAYNAFGSWNNGAPNGYKEHIVAGIIDATNFFFRLVPESWLKDYSDYLPLPLQMSQKGLNGGHTIAIQELNEDFTGFKVDSSAVNITPPDFEAPSIFARRDERTGSTWFYTLSGKICCFCHEGSNLRVFISKDSPMGPWVDTGVDVNAVSEFPLHLHVKAQSNGVSVVRGKDVDMTEKKNVFLWTGDLWHSSRTYYGQSNKGKDFQNWQVLSWNHDHTFQDFPSTCQQQDEELARKFGLVSIPMPCQLNNSTKTSATGRHKRDSTEL